MAKDYKIRELRKDEGRRGGGFEEPVVCEKELTVVRPSQARGWARSDHVVFSHKSRVYLLFGLIESSRRHPTELADASAEENNVSAGHRCV